MADRRGSTSKLSCASAARHATPGLALRPAMTPEQHYESWVRQCGGDRVIKRILIANNGMAAAKFILSIRNFLFQSFGDDQLIHIIAMATPEDMKASAKHLSRTRTTRCRAAPTSTTTPTSA